MKAENLGPGTVVNLSAMVRRAIAPENNFAAIAAWENIVSYVVDEYQPKTDDEKDWLMESVDDILVHARKVKNVEGAVTSIRYLLRR